MPLLLVAIVRPGPEFTSVGKVSLPSPAAELGRVAPASLLENTVELTLLIGVQVNQLENMSLEDLAPALL